MLEAEPTNIHGPISDEQARALYDADSTSARELLSQTGITDPKLGEVIHVKGDSPGTDRYVSANPDDAGTVLTRRTVEEMRLPELPSRLQENGRTYGGYSNIKSHQPGTLYRPGMPLSLDVDTHPETGDPKVSKLT